MPKRDHTKHCFTDEDELSWSGFMYDKDCAESEVVTRLFPRGMVTTRKRDPETVIEARADARTIVTSNETDFIRYMREAQRNQNFKACNDCWGLVWLPNPDFDKENALTRLDLQHGITVNDAFLHWRVVGYLNLCVHVHQQTLTFHK